MAGDGTTSVVVVCGALLTKCIDLLARGVHPTLISDAFGLAARKAVQVWNLHMNASDHCLVSVAYGMVRGSHPIA